MGATSRRPEHCRNWMALRQTECAGKVEEEMKCQCILHCRTPITPNRRASTTMKIICIERKLVDGAATCRSDISLSLFSIGRQSVPRVHRLGWNRSLSIITMYNDFAGNFYGVFHDAMVSFSFFCFRWKWNVFFLAMKTRNDNNQHFRTNWWSNDVSNFVFDLFSSSCCPQPLSARAPFCHASPSILVEFFTISETVCLSFIRHFNFACTFISPFFSLSLLGLDNFAQRWMLRIPSCTLSGHSRALHETNKIRNKTKRNAAKSAAKGNAAYTGNMMVSLLEGRSCRKSLFSIALIALDSCSLVRARNARDARCAWRRMNVLYDLMKTEPPSDWVWFSLPLFRSPVS